MPKTEKELTQELNSANEALKKLRLEKEALEALGVTFEKMRKTATSGIAREDAIRKGQEVADKIKINEQKSKKVKSEQEDLQQDIAKIARNKKYLAEHQANPENLFVAIAHLSRIVKPDKQEKRFIYAAADRAIAVSPTLYEEKDVVDLWICWHMANKARTEAYNEFLLNPKSKEAIEKKAKYLVGAREMFGVLIQYLPPELQLLKVFYTVGRYDLVEIYLKEFFSFEYDNTKTEADYQAFLKRMAADADDVSNMRARESLAKRDGFEKLAPNVQDSLIQQRAYVLKLRSYLSFSDVDVNDKLRVELYGYSKQLEENIQNAILHARSISEVQSDFAKVQANISGLEKEMQDHIFYNRAQAQTNSFVSFMSANATLALLLGAVLPSSVAFAATPLAAIGMWKLRQTQLSPKVASALAAADVISTVATAGPITAAVTAAAGVGIAAAADYESKNLYKAEEIEEYKELAKKMDPADVEFIVSIDKVWRKHTAQPVGQMQYKGKTLAETVKEQAIEQGTQFINEQLVKPGSEMLAQTTKPYINFLTALIVIGLASVFFTSLILTIVFPPLWPIWIVYAGAIVAGTATWHVLFPDSPIKDKVMQIATTMSQSVATVYNSIISPFRSLRANVQQGNIIGTVFSFVGAIFAGAIGIVLLPVVAPVVLGSVLLGTGAGRAKGMSFKEVINRVFYEPMDLISKVNAASAVVKKDMTLERRQIDKLNQLHPGFSPTLELIFKDRVAELNNKINSASVVSDPKAAESIVRAVEEVEAQWATIKLWINIICDYDAKDPKAVKALDSLLKFLNNYLETEYEVKRAQFIEQAIARKQQQTAGVTPPIPAAKPYVEQKKGFMPFAFKNNEPSAQAAKIIGEAPSFSVNGPKYTEERKHLEQLASLERIVQKLSKSRNAV